MFSFFHRKKEPSPPPEDGESAFEIVDNTEDGRGEMKPPDTYNTFPGYPSIQPPQVPVPNFVPQSNVPSHPMQDVPFKLSQVFKNDNFMVMQMKAKEILNKINRYLDDTNLNYDFNVERSVMQEETVQ